MCGTNTNHFLKDFGHLSISQEHLPNMYNLSYLGYGQSYTSQVLESDNENLRQAEMFK